MFVPIDFVSTKDFLEFAPFLQQNLYFIVWIKTIFAKYMGVWLIADGAVAITGLGYNGRERTNWKISYKFIKSKNCPISLDYPQPWNIEEFRMAAEKWLAHQNKGARRSARSLLNILVNDVIVSYIH